MQGCQVFLPPQVLLVLWTHGREHIVGVHDDVYKGVEEAEESAMSSRSETDSKPYGHGHTTMMDDMQCGHLALFLTQDEENLQIK